MPFFALFILLPLLELFVFVKACDEIGFFVALALLILAALIGGTLVRHQGFQTIIAMQDAMDRGKVPLDALFDGFCIVMAGVLLIFPGFITDVLAILLLLPHLRNVMRGFIRKHPDWHTHDSGTIEGEYEYIDDDPKALR